MISARDVMMMAVGAAMVLLTAGACQAAVVANLSLSVDQGAKMWKAYLTLSDPGKETLGLHGNYLNVWGSVTAGGPWTGPLDIATRSVKLPKGFTENDNMGVGFLNNATSGTKTGTGYSLLGVMQSNDYQADSDGYTSILMGVGEAAGSHPIGVGMFLTWTKPVLVASGTYTGSPGWINVSATPASMTLLPAALSLPSSFATFPPAGVFGESFYVPEPATLALLAAGLALLRRKRASEGKC